MFAQRLFQSCSSIASRTVLARPSSFSAPVSRSFAAFRTLHSNYDSGQPRSLEAMLYKLDVLPGGDLSSGNAKQTTTMDAMWKEQSKNALSEAERQPPAHAYSGESASLIILLPSSSIFWAGRSVRVHPGRVGEAIRNLDLTLARNRVRYYLRLQQRHEKRGEKLRRLKSERWRKQFANEVRLVSRMALFPCVTLFTTV